MLIYVRQAMEAHHLGLSMEEWTAEMVKSIRDEILDKAKADVANFD